MSVGWQGAIHGLEEKSLKEAPDWREIKRMKEVEKMGFKTINRQDEVRYPEMITTCIRAPSLRYDYHSQWSLMLHLRL